MKVFSSLIFLNFSFFFSPNFSRRSASTIFFPDCRFGCFPSEGSASILYYLRNSAVFISVSVLRRGLQV
ncbi:hypothetical protein Csa_004411 [Cucumis sativus]|uniref:Uncharacterized protein n=1 Tax=Cucumis sativus TaxID=3659 RepID=A0A0A0KM10_CUCSA|nr:hypothetical protein Csa_004411 [Cucumis sativus]